jgi:4-amino-4-deoxy-L-arabinose transferase-like glycosyltransferase
MAALMAKALPPRATALLLALTAGLLLLRLPALPLFGPDEPRYARVAVEMHRAHEWVRPTLAGAPWLEKPPLYYWLAGGFFTILGETEAAARLPSVVATLLLVGATALFGARLFGAAAGLHAGFILGTSVLPFAYGHEVAMDMLLAALATVALGLLLLRFLGIAGRLAVPTAFVAMGLATLAKGPLGFVLPAMIVLAGVGLTGDRRLLRLAAKPLPLALLALVAVPWYVAIVLDQGWRFVDVFLLNHNVARFTSTVHNHPGPIYYYLPILLLGLFPWTGLLLPALASLRPRREAVDLYLALWLAVPLVFFSLAGSKLPGYILPCLPPLAILMGRAAVHMVSNEDVFPPGTGQRTVAIVGLVVAGAVATLPYFLMRLGDPGWRATLPLVAWAVLVPVAAASRIAHDPAGALHLLRIGGAGLLALLTSVAPPILVRRESGRVLFLPARGRHVLAYGAWRTAWMAGYFYNDGRVSPVDKLSSVLAAVERKPTLVLCGPQECREIEQITRVETALLARGPRDNALLRVALRPVTPSTPR